MSVLFHSLCPLKSESKTLLFQVIHGWDYVPTDAKLRGGMPPKKGLSEEEITAKATVTPKGKEQKKADLGTPKEKTDAKKYDFQLVSHRL